MSGPDWIHTRQGITLVEGTLPRIARAIEKLVTALDTKEVEYEIGLFSETENPGPGWEPIGVGLPAGGVTLIVWRRKL